MSNDDSGWRPTGATDSYNGHEVWDFEHGPHELNPGEVDGEVSILTAEERADGKTGEESEPLAEE
ncbi:hypothetical protein [Halosegnis marinus]|uniref:Uncharacterized protein n=1 Tax=Halosegnis marinus TaxID=3034023 RepID=A0ABD5ZKI2_9EURY|nr:hypothetical protein [Halosegnis sp. DT85]